MPAFYPSSYGGTERRALRELNNCHEPGGKPEGGRFAKKGSSGCTDATVASTGQPTLTDTKTGQPKFDERPGQSEKKGLQIERPKDAKKKADSSGVDKVSSFTDNNGDADEALQALGVRMTAEEVASGMVSGVEGLTFSVTAESSSGSGGTTYDGPDPDDVRDRYENWQMDQLSEVESSMYDSEQRSYLRYAPEAFYKATDEANEFLAAAKGKDSFLDASVWDKATIELTEAEKDAQEHTLALGTRLLEADGIVNTEGFKERGSREKIKAVVDKYLAENPEAKFLALPVEEGQAGGWPDSVDLLEHSRWFNDNDGRDNWIEDGQSDGAGDDIQSFESWYEDKYGHHPDKYGQSSGFDDEASVEFNFRASDGSYFTRTVKMQDGELHVHHDLFHAHATGEGLSKQLFQGSIPTYDEMGVKSVSTYADIDVGAYTWARYGFVPDSPNGLARRVTARAKEMFKDTGLFDDADWRAFETVVGNGNNREFIWDVVDAKYYTTPEKAMALMHHWERTGTRDSVPVSNKKMRDEAAKGIVSVGRLIMVADNDNMNWEASVDLHDEDSVARLEGYIGVWRAGRQGFRAEPATPPSGGPLRLGSTMRSVAMNTGPGKPAPAISTFNNQYAALSNRLANPSALPSRAEVFSRMRNMGMTFENAVRSAAAARGEVRPELVRALGPLNLAPKPRVMASPTLPDENSPTYRKRTTDFNNLMKVYNETPAGRSLTDKQRVRIHGLMVTQGFNFSRAVSAVLPLAQLDRAAQKSRDAARPLTPKTVQQFDKKVRQWNKTHPPGQGIGTQTENFIWRRFVKGMTFDAAAKAHMRKRT